MNATMIRYRFAARRRSAYDLVLRLLIPLSLGVRFVVRRSQFVPLLRQIEMVVSHATARCLSRRDAVECQAAMYAMMMERQAEAVGNK